MPEQSIEQLDFLELRTNSASPPLIDHLYSADPSAHVFAGTIYIYPSHDIEAGASFDDLGSQFAMEDYHVFSMDSPDGPVRDHGVALHVNDVSWAKQQLWAPDAQEKNGTYYLFFPAKDYEGIFRIGVAKSSSPTGPFLPESQPIRNSFSIDPAVFKDDDGSYYMYFGGIWGGQLQRWKTGVFDGVQPASPVAHLPEETEPALTAKVAKLDEQLMEFAEDPKEVIILDENGNRLLQGDNARRFFEASWMHKYRNKYYFSYSTGDTHLICYGIGDNPYGPFTYAGRILNPVIGWTSHHSIVEFNGTWLLFYHDSILSNGVTHLRNIKVAPLHYDDQGFIKTINPYGHLHV